jgi:hypothetical protein
VVGGFGSDILIGGGKAGEVDILIGGIFADTDDDGISDTIFREGDFGLPTQDLFVLGNNAGSFYLGAGFADYALIRDFEVGFDLIQVSDAATLGLNNDGSNSFIFDGSDLIGIVEGVVIDLDTYNPFIFV